MKKYIYVLHEYGAPTHYHALKFLAQSHGYEIAFHTFKGILGKNVLKVIKYIVLHPFQAFSDICFLCSLPFLHKSKIVVGIAPFNNQLPLLMKLMKKHDVYYHTSYSCWDGSRYAHAPYNEDTKTTWNFFTSSYVRHIFAVSEWTKNQLVINHFADSQRISVVNHSFTKLAPITKNKQKELKYICVASLNEHKGISELLEIFSKLPEAKLTFVGKGELEEKIAVYTKKFHNIKYAGYINGSEHIIPLYEQNSFLVLNSHRTAGWEELFGMVIVEAMSVGCVPITTDHAGPKEIICNGIDGIICKEGNIIDGILETIGMSEKVYNTFRSEAIVHGRNYYCQNIASRWSAILE